VCVCLLLDHEYLNLKFDHPEILVPKQEGPNRCGIYMSVDAVFPSMQLLGRKKNFFMVNPKCEHGGRRNGGALRAGAAGAGGCAWSRWPAAGPLAVPSARVRRARPCRGRSPACLVFSGRWPVEGGAVARGRGPGARGGGGRWPARGAVSPAAARRRPAAVFVRGATARAEPVRRGESRPSRWLSSAAGVHTSRGGDDTSDSKTLPEYSLTRMRWRVQHAAYTCWV